jgi:hypothetical protein
MARRICVGSLVSLVVCTLLACRTNDDGEHDDNNFRPDVIECEDALSRLETCCPGFDAAPVLCNFYYDKSGGCGPVETNSVKPAFDESESRCIRDRSCDALVREKVCERAQAARAYTTVSSTGSTYGSSPSATTVTHRAVCP